MFLAIYFGMYFNILKKNKFEFLAQLKNKKQYFIFSI